MLNQSVNTSNIVKRAIKTQKVKKVKLNNPLQLNRVNLLNFILSQNGKFVSVRFKKLNGESRTLVGRLGVKKFLKGGQNKVESMERPYLTIFDIKLMKYRTVNLATISQIKTKGQVYVIVD